MALVASGQCADASKDWPEDWPLAREARGADGKDLEMGSTHLLCQSSLFYKNLSAPPRSRLGLICLLNASCVHSNFNHYEWSQHDQTMLKKQPRNYHY